MSAAPGQVPRAGRRSREAVVSGAALGEANTSWSIEEGPGGPAARQPRCEPARRPGARCRGHPGCGACGCRGQHGVRCGNPWLRSQGGAGSAAGGDGEDRRGRAIRVGAIWGIDDKAPNARRRTPERGRIRDRSLTALTGTAFDVLLSHDGPRDAVLTGSGSEGLGALIARSRPAFAFFGHYGSRFGRVGDTTGETQVYQMAGFEMRRGGACAEEGSVGLLTWEDGAGSFEYLDGTWPQSFTRHNWRHH
jgi:hypothetical protein